MANPLIYVSGPLTLHDPSVNTRKAIDVAETVLQAGGVPLVPHLSILWQVVAPKSHYEWIAIDLEYIERCDGVIRIPGKSDGADQEIEHAQRCKIPQLYLRTDKCDWEIDIDDFVENLKRATSTGTPERMVIANEEVQPVGRPAT